MKELMAYKLNGHEVVPCGLLEHMKWKGETPHQELVVGRTIVGEQAQLEVSTVFIGVMHNCIFETAIISDGGGCDVMQRYKTWETAAAGHEYWVEEARRITREKEE